MTKIHNPCGRRGLRVRVDEGAPAGLGGRVFPSLAAFLADLQELADLGRVPWETAFAVTVGEGTRCAHRRWAYVTGRGVAMVTGPGGERRGEMRACNAAAARCPPARTASDLLFRARAALRALAALDGVALARALSVLPEDQAALVDRVVDVASAWLGRGAVMDGAELHAFLRRMAAMDPRGAAALWLRAAGLRWEAAEALVPVSRSRLRELAYRG